MPSALRQKDTHKTQSGPWLVHSGVARNFLDQAEFGVSGKQGHSRPCLILGFCSKQDGSHCRALRRAGTKYRARGWARSPQRLHEVWHSELVPRGTTGSSEHWDVHPPPSSSQPLQRICGSHPKRLSSMPNMADGRGLLARWSHCHPTIPLGSLGTLRPIPTLCFEKLRSEKLQRTHVLLRQLIPLPQKAAQRQSPHTGGFSWIGWVLSPHREYTPVEPAWCGGDKQLTAWATSNLPTLGEIQTHLLNGLICLSLGFSYLWSGTVSFSEITSTQCSVLC